MAVAICSALLFSDGPRKCVILPSASRASSFCDPKVTAPIPSLGRANGIPAHDVFEIDASRQSTRMSANVSGFGKTLRITLNDNLLRRGSLEEILAVMGHEMGHYVLITYKFLLFLFVVIVFSILRWSLACSRAGDNAGVSTTSTMLRFSRTSF
jgi:STE24 endopeptidase